MSTQTSTFGLASAFLLLLGGCGGGGQNTPTPPPPQATSLAYTNPSNVPTNAFYLTKNASLSTSAHLVLDLNGPAGLVTGSGVVVTLTLDTAKATWGNVSGTLPVANGIVFTANANGAPIVSGKITGSTLQALVTERGLASAKGLLGPLLQIALNLKPGQAIGSEITLTPELAKSKVLLAGATDPSPLPELKVGTLTAQ
jgi:hypothetical protein